MKRIGKIRRKLSRKNIDYKVIIVLLIMSILGVVGWILSIDRNVSPVEIPCPMRGTLPYEVIRVKGAVVKIEVEGVGSGSGVFIRPNLILTAGHIIDMAEISGYYSRLDSWLDNIEDVNEYESESVEFIITCDDGTELISTEFYREEGKIDVGFLIVDPNHGLDIPVMIFSKSVFVGEEVFAIGTPMGILFQSVTSGVISAVGRTGFALWGSPLIQTDCPINPGNSGCPLFNMRGEIVGIVVGGYNYADGLGLCVDNRVIYWCLKKYDAVKGLERVIGK